MHLLLLVLLLVVLGRERGWPLSSLLPHLVLLWLLPSPSSAVLLLHPRRWPCMYVQKIHSDETKVQAGESILVFGSAVRYGSGS